MVRNIVKTGKSWSSAIICRKQSTFEVQFLLILVSIVWKTCVKDHRDSFSRFLERRIWLVCIKALLVSSFVNISAHFNKWALSLRSEYLNQTTPKCDTEPIWYVMLIWYDVMWYQSSTSLLCNRNCTKNTFLICKQELYPVCFSCRPNSYPWV